MVIGARASNLALTQTQRIVTQLQHHWPGLEIVVERIRTTGDVVTHLPLTRIGGDGVFVLEIERALLQRRIDLAVHSLKDVPTVQPAGLRMLAAGQREDARDVLVMRQAAVAGALAPVRIGTCSLRRTAQVRALFPRAQILALRGNIDTRLRKLESGSYDAIVLAAAGLHRLGVADSLAGRLCYLSFEQMLPAPGQGALGLEVRDEPELLALLAPLSDHATRATTGAERMFMRRLGAGCYLPVAAHSTIEAGELTLTGLVASLDGRAQVRVSRRIPWTAECAVGYAEQLGVELAEQALARGADRIIASLETAQEEWQHV
jgi:hydroxymethylbilane synthase